MIVGIDLGTTNSLVAVFKDGLTHLIPNAYGHVLTPSAVSLDENDNLLVGLAARERVTSHAPRTATAFKRWMGTDKKIRLGKRDFRAEELSALVLKSLKADAEAYLGQTVTEAVITVPAYFNEAQRKATKAAGELAGLKVERLLNEPTAAGLAYGLQEKPDHTTFLVFDLGGGTFDVSVLEYFDGVVEVRASAGDTQLGGEDFVTVLINLFLSLCDNLGVREKEEIISSRALWRVAEQAKRDLSDTDSTSMRLVRKDIVYEHSITREQFDQASAELLARLRRPIERALLDAKLEPGALAEVVLVGGATRMPIVRQTVARLFQRLPLRTINPDETIARGAAIQAALKARDAALNEVVLTDVMPYSLGVIISDQINGRHIADRFSPIIERNTPVPVSRVGNYCTVQDKQAILRLDVRQGESPIGSENLKLGELEVSVPPMPAGEANVDVRFSYDSNGLLAIDAKVTNTGQVVSTVIRQSGTVLSEAEIAQALTRLNTLKVHPREQQENTYLLERAKRLYEDRLGEQRNMIMHEMAQFDTALDTQDERIVRMARDNFRAFLEHIDKGFVL
jgi:molecular chaperone HscC